MVRTGEPWVLLHGTPLSPAVWDGLVAALDIGDRSTRPDLRAVPQVAAARLQGVLAASVVDALPRTPHHLVGHSFGGQVTLEMALAAPDLVRSLTLLCTRDSPFPPFAAAATTLRTDGPADSEVTLRRWFRPAELAADGPVVQYARRCLEDADPAAWAATLDAIAGYDRTTDTPTLAMPVTVIAAGLDPVSTPTAMAEMAARIPGATFHLLPEAAHMSPFVAPDALATVIAGGTDPT